MTDLVLLLVVLAADLTAADSLDRRAVAATGSVSETIVVTATRTPRESLDVPVMIDRLTADDLARTPGLGLDDRLRRIPGIRLFRRASSAVSHPTVQGVSLRGLGATAASRTVVLLDGVPVGDPFGGWVAWSRLPRLALDRVEIMPAAAGTVWGEGSLAGAIHLLTARPTGRLALEAEAGERGTAGLEALVGVRRGPIDGFVDLRGFVTGGYPTVEPARRGTIDVATRSRVASLYGRLGAAPRPSSRVWMRAEAAAEERVNGTPRAVNDTDTLAITVGASSVAGSRVSWQALASAQRVRFANLFTAVDDDRSRERPVLDQFDVFSDRLRLDIQGSRTVGTRHTFTFGGEARDTDAGVGEDFFFDVETERFLRRRRAGGDASLIGLFVQDDITLGRRIHLLAGLRFDRFEQRDGRRVETIRGAGEVLLDQRFEPRSHSALVPRLSLRWSATPRVDVLAGAYGGFRAPTANELYRPFRVGTDITAANAELEPERLRGLEAGIAARGRRGDFRLTLFANEVRDATANRTIGRGPGPVSPCGFVPSGGVCRQRASVGAVRVEGLEAAGEKAIGNGLSLAIGYAFHNARFARDTGDLADRRVPQVPRHQATLAVERAGRIGGRIEVRYTGPQPEDDLGTRRLDDALTVGLAVRAELGRRLEAWLMVENLGNARIEVGRSAADLVTVGTPRLVTAGIRWRP